MSSLTSLTTRAGLPTITFRSSTRISAGINVNAPTMLPAPTDARSMTTAFIPTNTLRPMCAPWMTAPCPICAPLSKRTVTPGNEWMTHVSWTLHPSSMTIPPQSPRIAALGPTYTSRPMMTLPIIVALSCTNADSCTTGRYPSNSKYTSLHALDDRRHPLADTDAHGRQRIPPAGRLELPRRGQDESCTGHPQRMTQRNRAAVRVDPRIIIAESERTKTGDRLGRERLV